MSNLKFRFNYNVSEPIKKNNVSIFFLSSKTQSSETFLTLDEAIANNLVEVSEVNTKGTVRYLKVLNKSDKNLLILGSEQIIGNALKQNRVVNNTTLVPGYSSIFLSVSCCEKNRWSPAVANKISISEFLFFPKGRINNYNEIFRNNKTDQFKIWDDISEKLDEFNSKSFTGSLEDIYNKKKYYFDEAVNDIKINSDIVGIAIAIGNKVISIEIFNSNQLLKKFFPKILRGIAFDSYRKNRYKNFLSSRDVYKLFRLIEFSKKKLHIPQNDCLGEEIRFNSDRVVGCCLNFKGEILHFSGFLKDDTKIPLFKSKVA